MEAKGPTEDLSHETEKDGETEDAQSESFDTEGLKGSLSAIDRQYAAQGDIPRRIHIIGTGSIGKLIAHALRGIANPPPITLILHRYQLLQAWEKSKKEITIQDDEFKVSRGGFDVELLAEVRRQHGVEIEHGQPDVYDVAGEDMQPHEAARLLDQQEERSQLATQQQPVENDLEPTEPTTEGESPQHPPAFRKSFYKPGNQGDYAYSSEPIHNLIVATKASFTIPALLPLRHRLSPSSTICFLQNGMGILDDINTHLFPSETSRPSYVQGIITHGVNVPPEVAKRDPFFAVHAGRGTIALGVLPRGGTKQLGTAEGKKLARDETWAASSRYLLRTLTRTPVLCAVGFTPTELLQQQLEKLAVNSILNPLTSLLDARNGALLHNYALTRTLRLLLAETSLVIRSLPELQSIPNISTRFSASRLEALVVSVAKKTKDNVSSMLADVRAGRRTEIEFINGYLVRRGEECGVKCVVNFAIMQAVVGKAMVVQREGREEMPMGGE